MDQSEFERLVKELKAGQNSRLKYIFQENAKFCISTLIFQYKCSREDAEDIYSDSILNFREKVIQDKISVLTDLRSYLYATCKNMLLVRFKKAQRITEAATVLSQAADDFEYSDDENELTYFEEIFKITEKAMTSLPEKCQALLKAFYFDRISLEEIAEKYNMANANVAKVSKSRCFQKLIQIIQPQRM
jgi:RNA polymerase sigma factor (sigma-70 family)